MEWIIYYAVALIFGGTAVLFYYYAVNHTNGKIKDIILYAGIGTFFAALSIGMFTKNGILVEVLLAILMGSTMAAMGIYMIYGVVTHRKNTEGVLTRITQHHSPRGGIHYELDFRIPDNKATYTVEYVSSDRKYHVGDTYKIYISDRDFKAYVHRLIWFVLGLFCTGMGVLWLSMIFELI